MGLADTLNNKSKNVSFFIYFVPKVMGSLGKKIASTWTKVFFFVVPNSYATVLPHGVVFFR